MMDAKFGRYEVRATLGRGSSGVVYDAWDPKISRRVAIKTVRLPDATDTEAAADLARFRREAQAAGGLAHPNLVAVYDYDETEDLAYIVMEFVDGETLKARLTRDEQPALPEIIRLMDGLLAGLRYSHERGVIHRDIKPANLMVTREGTLKIADFGIARLDNSLMTEVGTVMGTPAYMSPEQFVGTSVDLRTDIYSAGVVLYQLLTGARPFDGNASTIMHKSLNVEPPRPSDLSPTAPHWIDPVVAKALAKDPGQRFESAAAFAAALHDAISTAPGPLALADPEATVLVTGPSANPSPANPPAAVTVVPAGQRPRIKVLAAAAIVLIGGAAAGIVLLRHPGPVAPLSRTNPPPESPPAQAPLAAGQSPGPTSPAPLPAPQQSSAPPALKEVAAGATPVEPPVHPPAPVPSTALGTTAEPPAAIVSSAEPKTLPAQEALNTVVEPPKPPPPAVGADPVAFEPASLEKIRVALTAPRCSLVNARLEGTSSIVLSGVAGSGSVKTDLVAAIKHANAAIAPLWNAVSTSNPAFCVALDAVRPAAQVLAASDAPGFGMKMKGGIDTLHLNESIIVTLAMPSFPAYLYVDYLASNGDFDHITPVVTKDPAPRNPLAPGVTLNLGEANPKTGFVRRWVSPPYGTDMIFAVASSEPLFKRPRPPDESLRAYLAALQLAVETAREHGARLAADALLLTTER